MRKTSGPEPPSTGAPRGKIFYGWWVVLSAAVGLFMCYGPVVTFTFGVFFNQLAETFQWSRGEISAAYSLAMLSYGAAQPFIGRLVDRLGARKILLPALLLFGLGFGSLSALTPNLWHLYAVYVVIGIVGGGTTSMLYFSVLSRWFKRRRGLAFGLALSGNGLSAFFMPSLADRLIASFGWRQAYVIIGLMVISVTIPVVAILLKETPQEKGLLPDGEASETPVSETGKKEEEGISAAEARRSITFWLMASAFLLLATSVVGVMTHLVPMLTDRGVSTRDAALTASVLGGATLVGRLTVGYLLDRVFAPYLGASLFAIAGLGIFLLWSGAVGTLAFAGAFLVGIASSSDSLIPYLVTQYFGLRSFAEIYGYVVAVYVVGWMCGPLLMGLGFDYLGSYQWVLAGYLVALLTSAGLMLVLSFKGSPFEGQKPRK